MTASTSDRIVKTIELRASIPRVWKALTDYREFGEWFGVRLDSAFRPGKSTRGRITYPGYEHLVMDVLVERMDPERLFSFRWHPYAVDPSQDYSQESPTLVEFLLDRIEIGTQLTVTESGFDSIPEARRAEAFRMNDGGWNLQMKNIQTHVTQST